MSNNIVPIQEGGGGLDGLCKEPKLASDEKSATRIFFPLMVMRNQPPDGTNRIFGQVTTLSLPRKIRKFFLVRQGFEPTTFRSGAQAPIHYTTGPCPKHTFYGCVTVIPISLLIK